jgi:hypothetical protein
MVKDKSLIAFVDSVTTKLVFLLSTALLLSNFYFTQRRGDRREKTEHLFSSVFPAPLRGILVEQNY